MIKKNLLHLLFFTLGVLSTILAVRAYDFLHPVFSGIDKVGYELWIAEKKTLAYPGTTSQKHISYEINEGETCTPIKTFSGKAFLYTNVLCKDGEAWVIDKHHFDIIKAKEQP